ncbi:MAG TPA: ATP-binding protein, partial [Aggregatilineaceae bacterium]|nr:ATP-binding protein [Aggregatilineaceae bacterium]
AIGAENGVLGVEMARKHLPDLIVCDIMMPQLDGYGVLLALRSEPATCMIPFIFLTAKADRKHIRYGMELGADDYVTKPFTHDEFIGAIYSRLERQQTLRKEYEDRLEALRRGLVFSLSPGLQAPLNAVIGHAGKLITEAESLAPFQVAELAETMLRASQELHRQLENYLLYTQLEVMRIDPEQVIVMGWSQTENPGTIIAQAAQKKAADRGREADLALEAKDGVVRISRDGLKKIAEELIDNAFKFSQPGTRVGVTAAPAAGTYVLDVRDAGPGMLPAQIEGLRMPVRFERKLETLQKGGLGLIIADHLLRAHGGQLRIESAPEQGTHIFAELPLMA